MSPRAIAQSEVLRVARGWLGTPYRHQASQRGVGADCLGLIRGIWRELYDRDPAPFPPYTQDWAETLKRETLLEAARAHLSPAARNALCACDVVVFRPRLNGPAKHVAILSAPDRMIHAQDGYGVVEVSIGAWWRRRIAGHFVLPGVVVDAQAMR